MMDQLGGRKWLFGVAILLLISSVIYMSVVYIVISLLGPSNVDSAKTIASTDHLGDAEKIRKSVKMTQVSSLIENMKRKFKIIPYLFDSLKCSLSKQDISNDQEMSVAHSISAVEDVKYKNYLIVEEKKNKTRQGSQTVAIGHTNSATTGRSTSSRLPRIKRSTGCEQGKNCILPNCKCRDDEWFLKSFKNMDIPQIIYIAIDDAFQTKFDGPYKYMFWEHKNPNGCPLTGSMYITNKDTNYTLVKEYYERGWEMGAHSINHSYIKTEDELKFDSPIQRANLIQNGINEIDVRGWRSPYLVNAGENLPTILQNVGYTYDISHHMDDKWPFTLDFESHYSRYPYFARTPGFWIVPLNGLFLKGKQMWDPFVDGTIDDMSPRQITNFLWHNLWRKYKGDRTPFGIHTHGIMYAENLDYAKGIRNFFRRLTRRNLEDVYVVSAWQMLQWVQQPTKMSDIQNFKPWSC